MDSEGNYRKFMIERWISSHIDTFREPDEEDLSIQLRYYSKLIERFIPKDKNIKILEIGCGFGGFIYALKNCGYENILGIDIIPKCCNFVSNRFNIKVICSDILDYFNERGIKGQYDVIAAFDVIEHFEKGEIVKIMLCIYEALKENGIFISRVPYGGSLRGLYIRYSGSTHETAFAELIIDELFRVIGFKEVYTLPEEKLIEVKHIKRIMKKLINYLVGRILGIDPAYVNSSNIIAVGTIVNFQIFQKKIYKLLLQNTKFYSVFL
jgi:2-polyprenyl-3-methyl-5-hydroxy-6-metoxy-1,4-benzoquinol methylase